jgi:hypothetical protein
MGVRDPFWTPSFITGMGVLDFVVLVPLLLGVLVVVLASVLVLSLAAAAAAA